MPHNSNNSKTVRLETAMKATFHSVRPSPSASKKTTSVAAITRTIEAHDLQTFIKVKDECRRLVKGEQDRNTLLVEKNARLQIELAALTHKETLARHLAHHDELTGLPNRSLLQDRWHQALSQALRHHTPLGMLMVVLDNFKRVSDQLGHASGDKLLQAVAIRLNQGVRGADTVCRYGGDEFVIILPVMDSPEIATALATMMGRRLSEPYIIDGHKIQLDVSVGVAVYPDDGLNFDELMQQAAAAMHRAKGTGNGATITTLSSENTDRDENLDPLSSYYANRLRESKLFTQH